MSLKSNRKLFAPQMVTLPASAEELSNTGFYDCVVKDRACINALVLYPHRDLSAITLCCKQQGPISSVEASDCSFQR